MSDTDQQSNGATNTEDAGSDGTEKVGGLGNEGTIPPDADGIAAGIGDESSNFNPEEDPEADTTPDATPETNPSPS